MGIYYAAADDSPDAAAGCTGHGSNVGRIDCKKFKLNTELTSIQSHKFEVT